MLNENIKMIRDYYIPLVNDFLNKKLHPEDFVRQYFALTLEDQTVSPNQEVFQVLQAIFEDADAYTEDPNPAHPVTQISDEELRKCCAENLQKLKAIVSEYESK